MLTNSGAAIENRSILWYFILISETERSGGKASPAPRKPFEPGIINRKTLGARPKPSLKGFIPYTHQPIQKGASQ